MFLSVRLSLSELCLVSAMLISLPAAYSTETPAGQIDIGSRRELMVDEYLIASMTGASLRLHHPVRREIALVHDAAWEGNAGGYHTVFYDRDYKEGGRYRMYYHAWHIPSDGNQGHPLVIAYAESKDVMVVIPRAIIVVKEHPAGTRLADNSLVLAQIPLAESTMQTYGRCDHYNQHDSVHG